MAKFTGIKHGCTNLFFNWYEAKERQTEIDNSLFMNRKVFDRVILVNGRPTFSELFELSKQYPNDINCFCNSDVYFTDIKHLHNIKQDECFAITRDDLRNTQYASGSQDAWIFRGVVNPIDAPFTAGKWGSDNRLAYEIKRAGYKITNPSYSINLVHLHAVDNRNHTRTKQNTVPPPYLLIPSTI